MCPWERGLVRTRPPCGSCHLFRTRPQANVDHECRVGHTRRPGAPTALELLAPEDTLQPEGERTSAARARADAGAAPTAADADTTLADVQVDPGEQLDSLAVSPAHRVASYVPWTRRRASPLRDSPLRVTPSEGTRSTLTSRMSAAYFSRRTLVCMLVVGALALLAAGHASAGYGVGPNGQSFTVTADSAGYVQAPASLDLVVYLDAEDISSAVWVSDSPAISASGTPVGRTLGLCSSGSLLPFGETNKWVCRVSTSLLQPGHTYYWWLDFDRQDPGTPAPTSRVSGPFSFSLAQQAHASAAGSCTAAGREGPARAGLDEDDQGCRDPAELNGLQRQPLGQAHDAHPARLPHDEEARLCRASSHLPAGTAPTGSPFSRRRGQSPRGAARSSWDSGLAGNLAGCTWRPGSARTCRVSSRPSSRMPGGRGLSAR